MEYVKGNLFDTEISIIAHAYNNHGVMGAGIAKEFKSRFPNNFQNYNNFINDVKSLSENNNDFENLIIGQNVITKENDKIIVNMITQPLGRKRNTNYAAIPICLNNLIFDLDVLPRFDNLIKPYKIALPMIGAGLGGGDWNIISQILEDFERFNPVEFTIYYL